MIRSCRDLALIVLVSGFMVIFALNDLTSVFPISMIALLFVLFIPGYALAAAVFPGDDIGLAERVMIILAGSLAIAALGGLALHWLPVLLSTISWAILLTSVSIILSLIAVLRRINLFNADEPELDLGARYRLSYSQSVLMGLAIFVAIVAIAFSYREADQQATADFTQLWLLPVESASEPSVEVGVANHFSTTEAYELQLYTNGSLSQSFTLELEPGDEWVKLIDPPVDSGAQIEAILSKENSPDLVHRRVALEVGDRWR